MFKKNTIIITIFCQNVRKVIYLKNADKTPVLIRLVTMLSACSGGVQFKVTRREIGEPSSNSSEDAYIIFVKNTSRIVVIELLPINL